jgi:hypothetical protein
MKQKFDLPSRVEKDGSKEFDRVLRFIAKTTAVLLEIDEQHFKKGSSDNGD